MINTAIKYDPNSQAAKDLDAWLESPEGQKEIAESIARSDETIKELEEIRRVSYEELQQRVTI